METRATTHSGGRASRLRKAFVAAKFYGVIEPERRTRHSEAAAATHAGIPFPAFTPVPACQT